MEKLTSQEYYDFYLTAQLIGKTRVLCLHWEWGAEGVEPLRKFFDTTCVDDIKIDAIGLSSNGIDVGI